MSADDTSSRALADHYARQNLEAPASLDHFWMPFTANRQFKAKPRLLASASGMYYRDVDGNQVLDATAGLWCCNAGHARPRIVEAVRQQVGTLDFAPNFSMSSPLPFKLAERLAALAPGDLNKVFFSNSGSEAVDSALKIALAYHRVRGEGQRTRFIGREKGYHGVGFGGMSVGGLPNNRKWFGPGLPAVSHIRHTLDVARNAFSKGLPAHGIELAEDLERQIALYDASTIAAVIVEPISGSAGVVIPPQGYLQRLREICDRHGILLIFDEVITGFGRIGHAFGAQRFGVTPDMITAAKGITNGCVPMGATFVSDRLFDAFMGGPDNAIDMFHGYTYSGHPLACAAALATLDTYEEENLFDKALSLGDYWQEALHALKGLPNVIDIRNFGLVGAIEMAPRAGAPGTRGYDVFARAFHEGHLLTRVTGDVIALSPPLIVEKGHIDRIVDVLADTIRATA
ncbi:aspartate aminotransferase family protein [Pseudoxanthomonas sp. F37]|uniref:aspartate aminotransferase family protein n=1 Tax=Pseudoxanthomonas TaxID=83618 RepID=UPI001FD60FD9|nr:MULTISPECIES: aspartate aminotransferase family protein [Pseudoxanthomonas]UOV06043.1 aspartate aminotransferase family protein [Pseudoxanthomonas mexicana]UOV07629.1 aspartate aminotransferase family protein [Pseudoxanthomonas sp. F37]